VAGSQGGRCEAVARDWKADNGLAAPARGEPVSEEQASAEQVEGIPRHVGDAGAACRHVDVPGAASLAKPQRSRAALAGMQQKTHSAGVLGLMPVPLTLFAQGAGTTVCDLGLIDQTQAAVSLWSPFTTPQALASRAVQAPIGLEGKVGAREAARFPGGSAGRFAVTSSHPLRCCRWESRGKLCGA